MQPHLGPDNPGRSPHHPVLNRIISAKSLVPCQVPGLRRGHLGGRCPARRVHGDGPATGLSARRGPSVSLGQRVLTRARRPPVPALPAAGTGRWAEFRLPWGLTQNAPATTGAFPRPRPLPGALPRPQIPRGRDGLVQRQPCRRSRDLGSEVARKLRSACDEEKAAECPYFQAGAARRPAGPRQDLPETPHCSRTPHVCLSRAHGSASIYALPTLPALCTGAGDSISQAPLHLGFLPGPARGRH